VSESLLELGRRTLAAAVESTTALLVEGTAVPQDGSVDTPGDPFVGVELPAVVADVPFEEGTAGTFVLVLTHAGALRVAAALGAIDEEAAEFGAATLDDTALAAVGQLAQKIAVSAADEKLADARPGRAPARMAEVDAELRRAVAHGTGTVRAVVDILGEPAVLVQVVPGGTIDGIDPRAARTQAVGAQPLEPALHDVDVRVWAELVRTRMPTGEVVGLPSGAIVELDREAEDAVDLYVDGQLYATGRLVVTDDDSWGVRVERVLGLR
jgi:flagellar motor switch protein FliN